LRYVSPGRRMERSISNWRCMRRRCYLRKLLVDALRSI
jgi:hypothetical protein